jgi:hypothetical protein
MQNSNYLIYRFHSIVYLQNWIGMKNKRKRWYEMKWIPFYSILLGISISSVYGDPRGDCLVWGPERWRIFSHGDGGESPPERGLGLGMVFYHSSRGESAPKNFVKITFINIFKYFINYFITLFIYDVYYYHNIHNFFYIFICFIIKLCYFFTPSLIENNRNLIKKN